MNQFMGGCQCGNVRLVALGFPCPIGLCYCLDCRKRHGALFYASAVFPYDAVTITGEIRAIVFTSIGMVIVVPRFQAL